MTSDGVLAILRDAKRLAREYYELTGKHSRYAVKSRSTKPHAFSASS